MYVRTWDRSFTIASLLYRCSCVCWLDMVGVFRKSNMSKILLTAEHRKQRGRTRPCPGS